MAKTELKDPATKDKGLTKVELLEKVAVLEEEVKSISLINEQQAYKLKEHVKFIGRITSELPKNPSFFSFSKNFRVIKSIKSLIG